MPATAAEGPATPGLLPELANLLRDDLPEGGIYQDGHLYHTVAKGQSLGGIGLRYLAFTDYYTPSELIDAIESRNQLKDSVIQPGQRLEIPGLRTIPFVAHTVPVSRDFVAKGIYVTGPSAGCERIFTLIKQMKPAGLNAVVIDIKDMDGVVSYDSKVPLAVAMKAGAHGSIRDLPKLINLLHAQGIHVIARQAVFHDKLLAHSETALALKSKSGTPWRQHTKLVWGDPANREVQDYNIAIAKEVASLGVDEIQFDYIRFPAEGNLDDIAYSFDLSKTPKDAIITAFLKRASETLRPMGVLVSIDVYGVMAWAKHRDVLVTGQNLEDLSYYADVISPMLYPSHFYPPFDGHDYPAWEPYFFVSQGVRKATRMIAAGGARIRPWLQAFPYKVKERYGPKYVTTQIVASQDTGVSGFLLWNAGNNYDVGLKGLELWNRRQQQKALATSSTNRQTVATSGGAPILHD